MLRTIEPNQAPTAAFTFTCDGAACGFDGTDSSDADGEVASYAWDFGDGGTATGATPNHDFLTTGTRDVTLTVTDDEGTSGSVIVPVSVIRHNATPTATFTTSCSFLVCSFDARAASDSDGSISSYSWDFGNGETDTTTGTAPNHTYAAAGSYVVTLTVTDNELGTGSTTRSVSPAAVRPIALVGSSANQGNVSTPSAIVPAGTSTGDQLVMVLSLNDASQTVGTTTGVTGWTLLDSAVSGSLRTNVYTKAAAVGDGGRTVRFSLAAAVKYTLTVAVYTGDMLVPRVAKASETVTRPDHTTPPLDAGPGDWAISYWADKSSATTGSPFRRSHPTAGDLRRQCGSVCSVLADSNGAVARGYGGLVATADAASANATMWTDPAASGGLRQPSSPGWRAPAAGHVHGASGPVLPFHVWTRALRVSDTRPPRKSASSAQV